MEYITEPGKNLPICYDADVCVVGGGCTGIFAAVRAARLGARVVLIEKHNGFGGVASAGLVNVWHSLYDTDGKTQIIAGLTYEVIERLKKQGALDYGNDVSNPSIFNPSELKIELDTLVKENDIKVYLHTYYSSLICEDDKIIAVIIENKDGRSAIRAKFFIDATGDGDLARDLGIEKYTNKDVQPPSACFLLQGDLTGLDLSELYRLHSPEFGLRDDWGWGCKVWGCDGIYMRADSHVFDVMCNNADELTYSELEGRRQIRAVTQLLRKYGNPGVNYNIVSTCSQIGIRDTAHYATRFCANELDLLCGKRYPDAVLNGTYRVDVHHSGQSGITFKDLSGKKWTIYGRNETTIDGNWRDELGLDGEPAKFYQVPFDILVGDKIQNFIAAGRMLNADISAFGALRVMVNLNQLGEAAGVAAYLSLQKNIPLQKLPPLDVCKALKTGGSAF